MFLIIVNYGKLWQTFGEGHRDPCQYLANTVMMITWKTFHIQLRLTTCQTLHWLHTTLQLNRPLKPLSLTYHSFSPLIPSTGKL